MILTCPHCGFSKDVDPARIPDTVKKVCCPLCKETFPLNNEGGATMVVAETIPEPSAPSGAVAPKGGAAATRPTANATAEAVNLADLPKAGFWIRVAASMLDSLLAGLIQVVVSLILKMTASDLMNVTDPRGTLTIATLTSLAGMVIGITYSVFFTGYCGQTPGKMALGIKVVRTSGEDIGYGRAFLREVIGKTISTLLLGIGYLMVAFDAKKQGLHDRIADTYVIKITDSH